eukprot:COSAG05_NODE_2635_length_2817_cov_1.632082_2_plen_114_part_00
MLRLLILVEADDSFHTPRPFPLQGPTKQAQGTTDGRRIWGTRGDAVSDGAVEGRYGRYAERGGCAGHAAIAISRCGAAAGAARVACTLRSDERAIAKLQIARSHGSTLMGAGG